jgi:hypothetical protein
MVQGNWRHCRHVKRVLLSSLGYVIRRLETANISRSWRWMLDGDATWSTRKVILGWLMDTVAMTIQLPPHRLTHLFEILNTIGPHQRRTTINKWQKVLGELHYMILAIPGGKCLFSVFQDVLRRKSDEGLKVRLSVTIREILHDFQWLASDLARRPTWICITGPLQDTHQPRRARCLWEGHGRGKLCTPTGWKCPFNHFATPLRYEPPAAVGHLC